MWFKGLQIFQLSPEFGTTLNDFEKKIEQFLIRECTGSDEFTFGWVPLISNSSVFSIQADQCLLLRAAKETKVVDSSVLRQEVDKKVAKIEAEEGVKVGRKQKADIKEELTHTMRAKAPSKQAFIYCYIDLKAKLFVIDGGNASMVEQLFKLCQTTCGSFPIIPLNGQSSPAGVMTDWVLKNSLPASLESGSYVLLKDHSEDSSSIEFKKIEPLSDDVTRHLEQGMHVDKLEVRWMEKISFVLKSDLTISKLKFDDTLKETAFNDSQGGAASDMDASLVIMAGQVRELVDMMGAWFEIERL